MVRKNFTMVTLSIDVVDQNVAGVLQCLETLEGGTSETCGALGWGFGFSEEGCSSCLVGALGVHGMAVPSQRLGQVCRD